MDLLEWLSARFSELADIILGYLPKSPFVYLARNDTVVTILSYVNWFIPIYTFISILESWLIAISCYYLLSVILRWLKVIE